MTPDFTDIFCGLVLISFAIFIILEDFFYED